MILKLFEELSGINTVKRSRNVWQEAHSQLNDTLIIKENKEINDIRYEFKIFSYDEFFKLLNKQTAVNSRFNPELFNQSRDHFDGFYCILDDASDIVAAALVRKNVLGLNDKYVFIVQSLKKGYGKLLITHIFDNYRNVWLMSSPGDDGLLSYYDKFNVNKFILTGDKSVFNTDTTFYHNFNNKVAFSEAVRKYYGKNKLTESLEHNIKSAVMALGIFKYCSNNGNIYLFRDQEDPRQMSNFIRVGIDTNKKVLTIHGLFIDKTHKGASKLILDALFSNIDNTWTICLDNNLNPSFWNHMNTKYYPEFKFINTMKNHTDKEEGLLTRHFTTSLFEDIEQDTITSLGALQKELYKSDYAFIDKDVNEIDSPLLETTDESASSIEGISSPEELMDWMNANITYELVDDEYSNSNGVPTKTAEEVLKTGTGHCAEQSYLEKMVLDSLGYESFYGMVKENNSQKEYGAEGSAHLFLIYLDEDNKYCWFEHSMQHCRGIHKFNSLEELFKEVSKQWWRYDKNSDILECRIIDRDITRVDTWGLAKECYKYPVKYTFPISDNAMEDDIPLDAEWDFDHRSVLQESFDGRLHKIDTYIQSSFGQEFPGDGCIFIAPNGKFINIYPKLIDHEDLAKWLNERGYDSVPLDAEWFVDTLEYVRCRNNRNQCYIELPIGEITRHQLYALEEWLTDMVVSNQIEIEAPNGQWHTYDLKEYFSEDIIKIIKRFYSSGNLYEDLPSSDTTNENLIDICNRIYSEVVKYGGDDNQNCKLCAWAVELQMRGENFLPRPVYSPRDPIFNIKGEDIVVEPKVQKISDKLDVINQVLSSQEGSRFYCHVNWKDSQGGHEFILINDNGTVLIVDSQSNYIGNIETDSEYFNDINFDNSYIVRLDDKEINQSVLEYNDEKYIIEWDDEVDADFLEDNITESLENNLKLVFPIWL